MSTCPYSLYQPTMWYKPFLPETTSLALCESNLLPIIVQLPWPLWSFIVFIFCNKNLKIEIFHHIPKSSDPGGGHEI